MNKILLGLVFLLSGILGIFIVYYFRPPENILEKVTFAVKQVNHLKSPIYEILLGVSGFIGLVGLSLTLKGIFEGADS